MLNLLNKILELKRPETIQVEEYGKYTERTRSAVYNDGEQKYSIKKNNEANTVLKLESSNSFVECIKEELKRRENATGKLATVKIGYDGATFTANDDFNEGRAVYTRKLSQQWQLIEQYNGETLDHEEFLHFLLKISPSIIDFPKTYMNFVKLRIVGHSELTSNPIFVQNTAETGYMVKYKIEGQNAQTIIPEKIVLNLPYQRFSKDTQMLRAEVQVLSSESNRIRIRFLIPTLENDIEKAIEKEIEEIKSQLTEYKDLLILADI